MTAKWEIEDSSGQEGKGEILGYLVMAAMMATQESPTWRKDGGGTLDNRVQLV